MACRVDLWLLILVVARAFVTDFSELRTCEHRLDGSRNNITVNANQSSDITLAALRLLMQQAMARICKRLNPCLCGSDLPKHICGN